MKIAVIGSTGYVGSNIIKELVNRGFEVLGISNVNSADSQNKNLKYVNVNVLNTEKLVSHIQGYDVLISAFSAGWGNPNYKEDFINGATSIQRAAVLAGINRYIVIGGSGSLYVSENVQAVDTDAFPEDFKPVARATRDYYKLLSPDKTLNWLYISPAFEMHPGITAGRTGNYRSGTLSPIYDGNGRSSISVEDLAVAVADETEKNSYKHTIYTVAY